MTHNTKTLGRTTRRVALIAASLSIAATGTAAAHGSGGHGGGMLGGGWGLFGGGMALWGLLWMGLLIAVPLSLVYALRNSDAESDDTRPRAVLRERYARGELTDEEYEQRRTQLEQST